MFSSEFSQLVIQKVLGRLFWLCYSSIRHIFTGIQFRFNLV